MKQKNIHLTKIIAIIGLLLTRVLPVTALIDVTTGVSGESLWISVVPNSNAFDFLSDQQTGSGSVSQDLVGGPKDFGSGLQDYGVFYIQFDDQGTVSTADDELAFRMRINNADGVKKDTYQYYAFVGLDYDLNGSIDFFLGMYNPDNNGSKSISIYSSDPGKLNISPSTTGFGPQLKEITPVKNDNWSLTVTDDGSNFSGDVDYFISWKYKLSDINSALATVNPAWVMSVTTPLRMVIGTAAQDNAYNQDMGGIEGIDTKSTATWTEMGVFAPVVTPDGEPVVINLPPVAENATYTLTPKGTVTFTLGASDPENDALTFTPLTTSNLSDPTCGTLSGPVDGVYTYTDLGGCTDDVTLSFTAHDGTNTSNTGTITLTLNLPPTANDSSKTLNEGESLEDSVSGSDPESKPLTYTLVKSPLYGTLTFNSDGTYIYTHDGSENFEDSFTFYVNDGTLDSNTAIVTLTITPINEAPSAEDDTFTIDEEGAVEDIVVGNDPESDVLTYTLVSDVLHGTLTLNPDGTFTYQHDGSESTTDSFTYKVNDGKLDSAIAMITLIITSINEAPSAEDAGFAIDEGGTIDDSVTGSDPEDDWLTFSLISDVLHGTLTFNDDGTFTYIHDGSKTTTDHFTFKVNDGSQDSNTATVTITITLINKAPSGDPDTVVLVPGQPYEGQLEGFDPDRDELTFEVIDQPAAGTLTLNLDGSYTFTPPTNQPGPLFFTYRVCDGVTCSDPIMVTFEFFGSRDVELPNTGQVVTWPYIFGSGTGLWFISRKKRNKKTT